MTDASEKYKLIAQDQGVEKSKKELDPTEPGFWQDDGQVKIFWDKYDKLPWYTRLWTKYQYWDERDKQKNKNKIDIEEGLKPVADGGLDLEKYSDKGVVVPRLKQRINSYEVQMRQKYSHYALEKIVSEKSLQKELDELDQEGGCGNKVKIFAITYGNYTISPLFYLFLVLSLYFLGGKVIKFFRDSIVGKLTKHVISFIDFGLLNTTDGGCINATPCEAYKDQTNWYIWAEAFGWLTTFFEIGMTLYR